MPSPINVRVNGAIHNVMVEPDTALVVNLDTVVAQMEGGIGCGWLEQTWTTRASQCRNNHREGRRIMVRHRRLLFVAFLVVMLAATPAFASGQFSFRGGHGWHQGFQRHHPHVGRHFSFGVPHHQRFGQPFGFQRHPKFFHTPFQHHHFSPHLWRR